MHVLTTSLLVTVDSAFLSLTGVTGSLTVQMAAMNGDVV